jgi:hypothetical protein
MNPQPHIVRFRGPAGLKRKALEARFAEATRESTAHLPPGRFGHVTIRRQATATAGITAYELVAEYRPDAVPPAPATADEDNLVRVGVLEHLEEV